MKKYRTLLLDKETIARLAGRREAIEAVEYAFRQIGLGRVKMPPKIYLHLDKYCGDFRAMPAYIEEIVRQGRKSKGGSNLCGIKWVNVHPNNRNFGLPTVMAVIILNDPETGFPLCIMDGTYVTRIRTGAGGAVSAKYLARKNSKNIALIGCGIQARSQLLSLSELFKIEKVKVCGLKETEAKIFVKDMKKSLPIDVKAVRDIPGCIENSDIIITTTPSRKPLVLSKWINEGVHINAIGADSKGKQELSPGILKKAKVVVDNWEQASHSGEINVPVSKGIIKKSDIYAEIGEIVCGRKNGRVNDREITVFDSTGLAVQDVAVASLIYRKALRQNKGRWISIL